MKKIVIVGGGFAGLWSALSAIRLAKMHNLDNKVEITLINNDAYHGLRPRFYEDNLDNTRIPLEKYLAPLGVYTLIGEVTHIDHPNQKIIINQTETHSYDKFILATGSQLCIPNIPGFKEYAFNIDTYHASKKLKAHIESLPGKDKSGRYTIAVAGGGFTGIEAATNFMDRLKRIAPLQEARVIVIDRSQVASQFSPAAQKIIFSVFNEMGIETISNAQIKQIASDHLELTSGEIIATQTLVWTAGMQSNPLARKFGIALDYHGRLPVDRYLRIQDIANCFAAGDAAAATTDGTNPSLLSCQHAMPQGRFAGHNAAADLFGKELLMYEQLKYVTCLDLGSWGGLYTEGWDQQVIHIKEPAKKIKLFINHNRIYPPAPDDINKLLAAAEPAFKAMNF